MQFPPVPASTSPSNDLFTLIRTGVEVFTEKLDVGSERTLRAVGLENCARPVVAQMARVRASRRGAETERIKRYITY